jgi:plasmid stability protein
MVMGTLHVKNVPEDRHEALRRRAKAERRTISAEVPLILEQSVPTAKELRARQRCYRKILREHSAQAAQAISFN